MKLITNPGTPQELFEDRANLLVAQMTYPELINFLLKHRNPKQAEDDLHDITRNMLKHILEVWKPKAKTMDKTLNELISVVRGGKFKTLKYRVIERDSNKRPLQAIIVDKDCILCKGQKLPIFQPKVKEIYYCSAIAGFVEAYLNSKILRQNLNATYKSVEVRTISSIGSGDKICSHSCILQY
jgi:hypothetical protein